MSQPEQQDKPQEDPLAFSTEVHAWLDEVANKIDEFRTQLGTPTLAIDAGALTNLTQIERVVNQARMDLNVQVPPEAPAE